MNNIGTKIAELRKSKGKTQEELASLIGVSPQTISKWENSTTMPDITLLPLIADIFGITMDELFGINTNRHSDITSVNCAEFARNAVLETIDAIFSEIEITDEKTRIAHLNKSIDALSEDVVYTVGSYKGDMVYVTKDLGISLLMHRGRLSSMLKNKNTAAVIKLFANDNIREVFSVLCRENNISYTAGSLCKKLNLSGNDVSEALEQLTELRLVQKSTVQTDSAEIQTYHTGNLTDIGLISVIFACAEEYISSIQSDVPKKYRRLYGGVYRQSE